MQVQGAEPAGSPVDNLGDVPAVHVRVPNVEQELRAGVDPIERMDELLLSEQSRSGAADIFKGEGYTRGLCQSDKLIKQLVRMILCPVQAEERITVIVSGVIDHLLYAHVNAKFQRLLVQK